MSARGRIVRQSTLGGHDQPDRGPLPAPPRGAAALGRVLGPLSSVVRVDTGEKVLALTYDDGPDPVETRQILAALARHEVRATFFVLAGKARAHPEVIREQLEAGHEIGLHGLDHARLTRLGPRRVHAVLRRARDELADVTGRPVRLYRPTYGAESLVQHLAARRLGMATVNWSAWCTDWLDAPVEEVAQRAVRAAHPGAVLLLHDVTDDTDGARPTFDRGVLVDRILTALTAGGYRTLPVTELLARHSPVSSLTVQRPGPAALLRALRS